jgi:hypothetical protein
MGEEVSYGDAHEAHDRLDQILESLGDLWLEYQENSGGDGEYKVRMYDHRDRADEVASGIGIDAFDEQDWVADADAPAVTVEEQDDDYPWKRDAVEEVAAAWNTYQQIRRFVDSFPRVPDDAAVPDVEGGRRYKVKRALKEQYDVGTVDELRQEYTDEDGEPLYTSRREFRDQVRAIAGTDLVEDLDDDTDARPAAHP